MRARSTTGDGPVGSGSRTPSGRPASTSIAADRSRAMLAMTSGSWMAVAVWWMK
jgi:hypothetical protein